MKKMKLSLSYFTIFLLLCSIYTSAQEAEQPVNIGRSIVLASKILNENRRINISLPDNYDESGNTKYPVIYILDGGVEEDFIHLTGLVRYNSQSWVARIPASIVIGIENTNRRRDFTFAVNNIDFIEKEGFKKEYFPQYGNSANYMDFLEKELKPYVDRSFNTNTHSTIIGESLAGLMASEIVLKRPYLFERYIIISPSLWWGEGTLITQSSRLLQKNLQSSVQVYLGAPNKEEDIKMYNEVEQLHRALKDHKTLKVDFDYLPDETHATVIHQAVYNAFKLWAKK